MKVRELFLVGLIGACILGASACGDTSSPDVARKAAETETPTPEPVEKKDDFEERLRGVQTGNFDYVFAFRRKDGAEFDKEDKRFLKQNAPASTNQWVLTRDDKAVIAGSNYKFTPENMENLKSRFNIENYSKVTDDTETAGNTNVKANANSNGKANGNIIDNRNKNANKSK